MLEENAMWLIYLYGLYEDLGGYAKGITIILSALITITAIIGTIFVIEEAESGKEKEDIKAFWKKFIVPMILVVFIIATVRTLLPSRNIAIMMISAEPVIATAKTIRDSNTTKSLVNILDNSVLYLEQKSKELIKD